MIFSMLKWAGYILLIALSSLVMLVYFPWGKKIQNRFNRMEGHKDEPDLDFEGHLSFTLVGIIVVVIIAAICATIWG